LRSENIKRFGWFVGDNMGTAGITWLLRELAIEAMRTVKPSGSLIIFADWRLVSVLVPAIESAGLRYQSLLVWNKGSMGLGNGFRHQHELAMHFTMGAPEYWNKGTSDVFDVSRMSRADRVHQTQKPVELLGAISRVVCPPGGVVLDTFCGSASTAVATVENGQQFLCFEIDPSTAEMARERVRNTQPPLFVPPQPEQARMGGLDV